MKLILFGLLALMMIVLLSGCGEKFEEIKQAAGGINSKANEAITAISADVHAIRATELSYKEHTFTLNDAFKIILRDVQWFYDEQTKQLKITGTWQNNGLFAQQQFDEETKKALEHEGDVEVILVVTNGQIEAPHTQVTLTLHKNTLLTMSGANTLYHLYDVYVSQ